MKRQKVKLLLAMLVLFLGIGCITNSVNAASIGKVTSNTILDTDYSFTFGFVDGVTTTQVSSSMTNNPIDARNGSGVNLNNYYSIRLTSDDQKLYKAGNNSIWVRYNNVGTYKGQAVDLKITLKDWDYLQQANTSASSYPTVYFAKDRIGGYITSEPAVCEAMFRCEFFVSGTNTPILVRGYQTFTNIEDGEVLSPFTGFDYLYLESGSHLLYNNTRAYAQVNDPSTATENIHWATGVLNGSFFEFKYHRLQDVYQDTTYRDVMQQAGTTKRVYGWDMTNKSLVPFAFPTPEKVADVAEISGTDSVKYTVTQDIPYEYSDFYYDNYIFTDEIAECFNIKSVVVKDANGINRTNWFNIAINGNTITATATSNAISSAAFYDNTLYYVIDVQKKYGYDLQAWMKGLKCVIPNTASITMRSQDSMYHTRTENVTSSIANVACTFDVATSIENGTITESRYKQPAGSSQSVTFTPATGYYITAIIVDGVEQDLAAYNVLGTNTYTFKSVSVDHEIKVICSSRRVNFIVNKTDAKTINKTQGDATFKNAVYGVYTDENCTNLVTKVTLDEKGTGLSDDEVAISRLVNGEYSYYEDYYIKEITAPEGYNLSSQVSHLTLDVTNLTKIVTTLTANTNDTIISNSIVLTKYLEKTADTVLNRTLENVMFTATLDSDVTKTYSVLTDSEGKAEIKDLPYGTYTIVEQSFPAQAWDGQFTMGGSSVRIKKFSVFIQEDSSKRGPYTYDDIVNVAKKMNVSVFLLDAETGLTTQGDAKLEGAEYTIYTDEECTNNIQTITIAKDEEGVYSATSSWFLVGTYYIKQTKAPEGYLIDEKVYTVTKDAEDQTEEFYSTSITSRDYVKRNNIEITKYLDETISTDKQTLSGAVFTATLKSNTSTYGVSSETDSEGKCIIRNLPYGTYIVRETTVPALAFNAEFYVNGGARTTSFTQFIENDTTEAENYKFEDVNDVPKKMNITVYLEDAESGDVPQGDAVLDKAEYTIYSDVSCDEEEAIETLTIELKDGKYQATSGWYLVGTYYVKQTKAPTGYLIDNEVYTVTQIPEDQASEYSTHEVTSKDYVKRNNINIKKYLDGTYTSYKQPISGAVFTATLDSDNTVTFVSNQTNEYGECVIEGLMYGKYTIHESFVPDLAYNGEFTVDLGERTTTFNQFVENDSSEREPYTFYDVTDVAKKMSITIFAEDTETGTKTQGDATLAGAEYTLYSDPELTNEIETLVIAENEDGTWSATSNWYLTGTYWFKQTKAPKGYLIDEKVYTVSQEPNAQNEEYKNLTATSQDKVKEGSIRVSKFSNNQENDEKIPAVGAKVRLTLDSDPTVYFDAIIDEIGYAEFVDTIDDKHFSSTATHCYDTCYPYTIPFGVYSISEEVVSDQGENIFIYKQKAEIREQDQLSKYILDEEYVRMRLTVNKADGESGATLAGAKFKIWDISNQRWYSERVYGSGEYIDEFTVNNLGYFTIKGFLESGTYVIYETKAPYGYYIDKDMMEGAKGYELTVGVNSMSQVIATHDGESTVLQKQDEIYEGLPIRVYPHSLTINNLPQKAVINVTDLASQFTNVSTQTSEFGNLNTPEFQDKGLLGAEFDIVAKEDIVTEYGTVKYQAGDVVEHIVTDENGTASTSELYLGQYQVVQTKVPNGFVLDSQPRDLNITYVSQDVEVQQIPVNYNNKKQHETIAFEKLFDRIYDEIFVTDTWESKFGLYAAEPLKNYRGVNTLAKDELIEVIESRPNHVITNLVDLPAGKYYLKELSTSNPYEISKTLYEFTIEFTTTEDMDYQIQINGGKINNTTGIVSLELLVYPQDVYTYFNINSERVTSTLETLASKYGMKNMTYGLFHDKDCTRPVYYFADGTQVMYSTGDDGKIYIEKMPTGTYYLARVDASTGNKVGGKVFEIKLDTTETMYVEKIVEGTVKGDMNVDGFVNSTDAAMVLDLFKNGGATEVDYLRGDMDENNILNATDAAMILDIFKMS